jgi:hypothetical protein
VRSRGFERLGGGIKARDGKTHCGELFGEHSATAPDVQRALALGLNLQPGEDALNVRHAPRVGADLRRLSTAFSSHYLSAMRLYTPLSIWGVVVAGMCLLLVC